MSTPSQHMHAHTCAKHLHTYMHLPHSLDNVKTNYFVLRSHEILSLVMPSGPCDLQICQQRNKPQANVHFTATMEVGLIWWCPMWEEISLDFLLLFWWGPVREVFIHAETIPVVYVAGVFKVSGDGEKCAEVTAVAPSLMFSGPGIEKCSAMALCLCHFLKAASPPPTPSPSTTHRMSFVKDRIIVRRSY